MYRKNWKPNKAQAQEFVQQMARIRTFCAEHKIDMSYSEDSYYFTVGGQNYRVSNHSVESSWQNSGGRYHEDGRRDDTIYIHASKTRIIDIYNDLAAGHRLDGRGNRID